MTKITSFEARKNMGLSNYTEILSIGLMVWPPSTIVTDGWKDRNVLVYWVEWRVLPRMAVVPTMNIDIYDEITCVEHKGISPVIYVALCS